MSIEQERLAAIPWARQGNRRARDSEVNHALELTNNGAYGLLNIYLDQFDQQIRFDKDITVDGVTWDAQAVVDDGFVGHVMTTMRTNGWDRVRDSVIWNVVRSQALRNRRNPFREWLTGLTWDGVPRLDSWLPRWAGAADTAYVRAVGAKWLCAAVGRVMEPGLKFDSVLVLHGRKGGGKSSVLRALGGAHFAEVRHLGLKGSRGNHPMIGKWLGEVPEIDRLISGDGDAAEFKSWISLRADRVLKPYARVHEDIPRAWVLAGTTNEVGWIRDTQNERRWWVVTVGDTLDVQGLAKVREQLLAEAVTRWPTEPLYMETEELRRALKEALESFAAENPLEVKVGRWVAEETAPALRLGGLSGIALNVDDLPDCDVTNPRRRGEIRAALTALGMTSKRPRVNGRRAPEVWGWISQEAAQACVAAYGQDYESEF